MVGDESVLDVPPSAPEECYEDVVAGELEDDAPESPAAEAIECPAALTSSL